MILGLDISSKQLDGCWVGPDGIVWKRASLGKGDLVERLTRIPDAMNTIYGSRRTLVKEVVIEDAYGPSRTTDKALWGVIGGIIATVPIFARVTVLRTSDWRAELGAKDTKPDGHVAVWKALEDGPWTHGRELDEHELDACGISLAWKHRLEAMANE